MASNLVWVLLEERFFLPNAISFLCCFGGLLFSPSWICPRRSFLYFAYEEKRLEKCFICPLPWMSYTGKLLAVVGSQEVSVLFLWIFCREANLNYGKMKLQWTIFVCTPEELLTEPIFNQPGHHRLLCMVCEHQYMMKHRFWVGLGYTLFHVTVLPQRWEQSFYVTLHWLTVYLT